MIDHPWAILLCKFKDDTTSEPYGRQRYEDLFTSAGVGKMNMVDFFRDMSHGQLDLSRSRVFGWYTLDKTLSDYKSGVAADVNEGRGALIEWARQAAEVDLTEYGPFFSVLVCMNVVTDVFGGATGAACDDGREPVGTLAEGVSSMSPSVVGQEMGHVYGLQHSRRYGSPDAYKDRWDAMSTKGSPYMAAHPFFTEKDRHSGGPVFRMGPGLNAANMSIGSWLDPSRVWSSTTGPVNTVVSLRPLHQRDVPGFLAIRFHDYFVEFRTPSGWDAALDDAVVLVHKLQITERRPTSYLVSDSNGNEAFGPGSYVGTPDVMSVLGSNTRVEVVDIDAEQQVARIRLMHTPAALPQVLPELGPYRNPSVAWSESGQPGDVLITMGTSHTRIARDSPFARTLAQISLFESSGALESDALQTAVRREALSRIAAITHEQLKALEPFHQPAPSPVLEASGLADSLKKRN